MRGISLISGVLFLAILIVATSIVYWASIPVIQKIQCTATMEKMKSSFIDLDKIIQEVVSEGEGSRRTVDLNVEEGKIYVNGGNDTIYWEYECAASIFSPRTSQTIGNVEYGANLDTSAYVALCSGETAYVLENEHIIACFKIIGSEENPVAYNTSDILLSTYQKDTGQTLPMEYMIITLDNNETSANGTGYTELQSAGTNLPYGSVDAFMSSDYGIDYTIHFTLESGTDFLVITGE